MKFRQNENNARQKENKRKMGYYNNKGYTEQEKTAQAQEPKKEISGIYVSPKTDGELDLFQRKKTIFMLLSTLLFAIAILLPADISTMPDYAMTYCVIIYLAGITFSVIVQIFGKKRHKIRKAVPSSLAPRAGYGRYTYVSFEFFVVVHVFLVVAQAAVVLLAFSALAVLSLVCMVASLVLALISRRIFVKANKGMELVPIEDDEQDGSAEDEVTQDEVTQDEKEQDGSAQVEGAQPQVVKGNDVAINDNMDAQQYEQADNIED